MTHGEDQKIREARQGPGLNGKIGCADDRVEEESIQPGAGFMESRRRRFGMRLLVLLMHPMKEI